MVYHIDDGSWSPWGQETLGACSVTCGTGKQTVTRTRKCDNPAPSNGGKTCPGESKEEKQQECKMKDCSGKLLFYEAIIKHR